METITEILKSNPKFIAGGFNWSNFGTFQSLIYYAAGKCEQEYGDDDPITQLLRSASEPKDTYGFPQNFLEDGGLREDGADCWVHKFSDGSSIEVNNGDPVIYSDFYDYLVGSNQYLDGESGLIMSNED